MSVDHDDRTHNFCLIKYNFVRSKCLSTNKLQYYERRILESGNLCEFSTDSATNFKRSYIQYQFPSSTTTCILNARFYFINNCWTWQNMKLVYSCLMYVNRLDAIERAILFHNRTLWLKPFIKLWKRTCAQKLHMLNYVIEGN